MQQARLKVTNDGAAATALLPAMLEAIDTGVAAFDDQGCLLAGNGRFVTMLDRAGLLAPGHAGAEPDRLTGVSLDLFAPGLASRPAQVRGPGGRVFEISYKTDPAGLNGTLVQLRDVTGRVIDAGAVDEARLKAEQIENARNAFVSQVAHHFRTPLHVILGYVDILADAEPGSLDQSDRNSYLDFIRDSAAALLLNMNEMMEIIRLQRDELPVEIEIRDLGQLVSAAVHEAQADLDAEQAELDSDAAIAGLTGVRSRIDVRLARRGLSSLLRTCAVLGGQGCRLELSADMSAGSRATLNLSFETGRATPADVVASVDMQEPVKEISLTGRASGYGIVLAVLLLRACNAEVAVEAGEGSLVIMKIRFDGV